MRKVAFLSAVAAVLVAAPAAYPQAETIHTTEQFAFDAEAVNECTGETIHVEGTGLLSLQTTIDASGGMHFHVTLTTQNVIGTTATGERVRFVSTQVTQVSELPSFGEFTTLNNFHSVLVAQGPDNNWLVDFTVHFTITPNGELTGLVDQVKVSCQ